MKGECSCAAGPHTYPFPGFPIKRLPRTRTAGVGAGGMEPCFETLDLSYDISTQEEELLGLDTSKSYV